MSAIETQTQPQSANRDITTQALVDRFAENQPGERFNAALDVAAKTALKSQGLALDQDPIHSRLRRADRVIDYGPVSLKSPKEIPAGRVRRHKLGSQ